MIRVMLADGELRRYSFMQAISISLLKGNRLISIAHVITTITPIAA